MRTALSTALLLLASFAAVLARPTFPKHTHAILHLRHQHHHDSRLLVDAIAATPAPFEPTAQKILSSNDDFSDDTATTAPTADADETPVVTLTFASTPLYPQTGHSQALISIPLGRTVTPAEMPSLPLRPTSARVFGIASPSNDDSDDSDKKTDVVCLLFLGREGYADDDGDERDGNDVSIAEEDPVALRVEDGTVSFTDATSVDYLDDRVVKGLRCM